METSIELRTLFSVTELVTLARENNGVVNANVDLSCKDISSFAEEITEIRGYLKCYICPRLTSLSNLQTIGGSLACSDCPRLTSLGNLQTIGGSLDCSNCRNLTSLGNLKSVAVSLVCYNCPLADDEQSLLNAVKCAIWLKCDAQGRRHCQDGHAVISNARGPEYFWHGVKVPAFVILQPESITLSQINEEHNAEVRRVMIFRYGLERYLKDAGGTLVDHDPRFGKLWRILIDDSPALMLEVVNSTPEPDGTFKHYFIPVRPTLAGNPKLNSIKPMDTAYHAAWSLHRIIWGLGIPYNPKVET